MRILTFNTLGIPFVTKNYKKRFAALVGEIAKVNPDVICLQEIWVPWTKRKLVKTLYDQGYKYSCTPISIYRLNGFLTVSRYEIEEHRYFSLKPIYKFRGFRASFTEFPGDKGYLLTRIRIGNEIVNVFNIHLTASLSGNRKKESTYGGISFRAVGGLSALVQEYGQEKMILCGDFNFEPGSWLDQDFTKVTGVVDRIPSDVITITKKLYSFPVPLRDQRLDFIYTKNIEDRSVKDVKVLWDQELPGLGYLSDHAGLFAEIDIEKRYKA